MANASLRWTITRLPLTTMEPVTVRPVRLSVTSTLMGRLAVGAMGD